MKQNQKLKGQWGKADVLEKQLLTGSQIEGGGEFERDKLTKQRVGGMIKGECK